MEMEKKKIAILILVILIIPSSIGNLILSMQTIAPCALPYEVLKVARSSNPVTIDPVDAWDSVSNDVLDQVVETLIAYDLDDPELPLIGRLAESWSWPDNTTLVFKLRENVFFHDGSRFTADCVLHTIARINFFGNWSGTLDPYIYTMAFPHSLYKFFDGTPIFNDTLSFATDEYNVTLVLNRPYGPAEGLLTYTASSIVHPDTTPAKEMLELSEDLIIGTGPFKLVRYIPNSEIRFDRWERYWRTGAYWDEIVYVYYPDAITAFNGILDGDVHWYGILIGGPRVDWSQYPNIKRTGDGVREYINGTNYGYISFKSEWINQTWRKAICHAFNYSYFVSEIEENTVSRAHSLVPPGFPAYNSSVIGGQYNIPYARQLMQKMGYGVGWEVGSQVGDNFTPGADEVLWQAAQFIPNVGNFTGNLWYFRLRQGSPFLELLIQRFAKDMDLIGIDVVPAVITYWWYLTPDQYQESLERLHFHYYERTSTYLDIFSRLDLERSTDIHKIDNVEINSLLANVLTETDTLQRYEYYEKLQYLIHDKFYYHMPLSYNKIRFAHQDILKGFPYNCLSYLYWYPTYWE